MEVIWTKTAEKNNRKNIDYVLKKYGRKIMEKYIFKVDETIKVLEEFPKAGSFEKEFDFYKIILIKQIYILYRIRGNKVVLKTFWNNKKKPFWN